MGEVLHRDSAFSNKSPNLQFSLHPLNADAIWYFNAKANGNKW